MAWTSATRPAARIMVVLAASASSFASAPQDQSPRFRTGVELVQLDVSVLDKNREPVRGLTAADFTILEDGRPQQITAFAEIDVPPPDAPPETWMHDVPWDIRRNDDESNRRVVMIVFNDGQMQTPLLVRNAKSIARGIVNRLGSGDLAAIVFTMNNSHAQDFTTDRRRLIEAIDRLTPGELPPFLAGRYPFGVVDRSTAFLSEIDQRRKVLVYIGPGLRVNDTDGDRTNELDTNDRVREIVERARRGNVSIYTYNPAGLVATLPGDPRPVSDDALRSLSSETGGAATVDTNAFDGRISRMFRENSAYYLIAFQSSNPGRDGRFRTLDVRVGRRDVIVRARGGYKAEKAKAAPASGRDTRVPLASSVAGLLPQGELPMQVTAAPFALPRTKKAAVVIAVAIRHPAPSARVVERIELLASAFGAEGQARGTRRQAAQLTLQPVEGEPQVFEVLTRLDLPPGQYHLRVGAAAPLLEKSGSVYYDLNVPDFANGALVLSGLVVRAEPAWASGPKEVLGDVLPLVPTSRRVFTSRDRASAFVRVYQKGKAAGPVAIETRIDNVAGRSVFSRTATLETALFAANGSADHAVDIPGDLSPGRYLLTVDALGPGGRKARRDLRFIVE